MRSRYLQLIIVRRVLERGKSMVVLKYEAVRFLHQGWLMSDRGPQFRMWPPQTPDANQGLGYS